MRLLWKNILTLLNYLLVLADIHLDVFNFIWHVGKNYKKNLSRLQEEEQIEEWNKVVKEPSFTSESIFKCEVCFKLFASKNAYESHIICHDPVGIESYIFFQKYFSEKKKYFLLFILLEARSIWMSCVQASIQKWCACEIARESCARKEVPLQILLEGV